MEIERRSARPSVASLIQLALVVLLVVGVSAAIAGEAGAGNSSDNVTVGLRAPESYGGWVLAPAIVAIVCAILARQVVPALFLGVLIGSFMMQPCLEPVAGASWASRSIGMVRLAVNRYTLDAIVKREHAQVIVFTLMIAGMVGVVGASGGTRALVDLIAKRASSRRYGQITAWVAGLVVFFDDYANSMIVGPTMQPICDRLRISRAKLAYIVDSTAAPVASIALVGTWVGAELGYIGAGLANVKAVGTPEFLKGVNAWGAFVQSIPYRFYAVLAIVMVFLVSAMGRDFGPMRRHEDREARSTSPVAEDEGTIGRWRWLLAGIPILTLVFVTGLVLLWPGMHAVTDRSAANGVGIIETIRGEPDLLFEGSDSYAAILFGAFACVGVAILLAVASKRSTLSVAVDAMLAGMSRVFPAIVVLVLAWALSTCAQDLHVGEVVSAWLADRGFALRWLPLAVFVCAAGVSFATGTSWGTMGILCPMVVRVAADLGAQLPAEEALPLFYASVGSVLSGAIFGDHCSPISDTTVLSSIASGCSLQDHVWTQLPYALVTAVVAMAVGDTLCSELGHSPWLGIAVGTVVLAVILRVFGKLPADVQTAPGRIA